MRAVMSAVSLRSDEIVEPKYFSSSAKSTLPAACDWPPPVVAGNMIGLVSAFEAGCDGDGTYIATVLDESQLLAR